MTAHQKPTPAPRAGGLKDRATTLRAATARQSPPTNCDACVENARSFVDQFDFAAFGIKDLGRLYEVVRQVGAYWGHLSNMPLCQKSGVDGLPDLTNVGWFIEAEENRLAFFRDRCVAEIAARSPTNDQERDVMLSVRIAHELDCSSRIDRLDAPTLLIEALKAWG